MRERYPVLLSNGNRGLRGAAETAGTACAGRTPFPKPSYLFALVAGDLHCHEGQLRDALGPRGAARDLGRAAEHREAASTPSLPAEVDEVGRGGFGLEYDLDIYMIVAVNDFNMGAMENKGLNVFNSKYVLARPETATDDDYEAIEGVIAHEYFHNWTGNRVTCRDWFQLTLKEGLTVFRDQQFTATPCPRPPSSASRT